MEDELPDDKLSIETPELIPLEFPLAGIGSRFLALAFDTLLQTGVGLAVLILMAVAAWTGVFARFPASGVWAAALIVLLAFLVQFGYFAFFEAIWNGQTPGKRRQHLRVIKDSGRPITTYDAAARNLLRLVDSLPGFYAVGILSTLLSSKNKRLGDYVAGTVVVHEKPLEHQMQAGLKYAEEGSGSRYDVSRLSPEEFHLIEAYLLRRTQLAVEVRAQLTGQIIQRLAAKLEISPDDQRRPEPLLERLATEYRNRTRFR